MITENRMGTPNPAKLPEIPSIIDHVDNNLDKLNHLINQLSEKLIPILKPSPQEIADNRSTIPQSQSTPLGQDIQNLDSKVASAIEKIDSIINGLAI